MKNKILVTSVLALAFIFAFNAYAIGQNSTGGAGAGNQVQQQTQTANQGEDSQIQAQNNKQVQSGNTTGTNTGTQTQQQNQGEANQIKNEEQKEQINAEQHRSTVANFVQGVLKTASSTEGGIGQQIRVIAQQQNQSENTTIQAMEKIQTRSKIKTFFLGSDYKNLGSLRSETVQTKNRLEQLNRLMENIQNEGDKTELQNQIQTLEQEQTKIESFIKAQEGKFSLFGWVFRLFAE
ncbi:MAG: hypothetical protein Q8N22_01540 [bacterium]|nr:hypothetical protein [bacterium]